MSRAKNSENSELVTNFAEFISRYIEENNLNNTSFGKLIGVDEATVRKYRSGKALPSHSTMQIILTITHTRYHKVLGFIDPEVE